VNLVHLLCKPRSVQGAMTAFVVCTDPPRGSAARLEITAGRIAMIDHVRWMDSCQTGIQLPMYGELQRPLNAVASYFFYEWELIRYRDLTDRERLDASLERFFRRIPVDKPVIRNNYFIQTNVGEGPNPIDRKELAWAESTVGSEDAFEHGSHGGEGNKEASGKVTVEGLVLRTERQTLRRLGRSGGVVFTIRTYLTRVVSVAEEEGVAGRLASALRSWPEDVGKYKGKERGIWFQVILEYLDQIVANK